MLPCLQGVPSASWPFQRNRFCSWLLKGNVHHRSCAPLDWLLAAAFYIPAASLLLPSFVTCQLCSNDYNKRSRFCTAYVARTREDGLLSPTEISTLDAPSRLFWYRLSRHGFTDVMKDTVDSYAETGGNTAGRQQTPIDLDLEATDPLAKHEITLQFAAFRAPPCAGRRRSSGSREEGERGGGGGEDDESSMPTSFYFTYQFYTCLPTRTERMLLRPDGQRDRLYQVLARGLMETPLYGF